MAHLDVRVHLDAIDASRLLCPLQFKLTKEPRVTARPLRRRPSTASSFRNSSRSSFWRCDRASGTVTWTVTIWLPRPRRSTDGRPLPRNLSFDKGWQPGGTLSWTMPSSVSTSTVAPSAASAKGTSNAT